MQVARITCLSCGAPVTLDAAVEVVKCPYCGTHLAVERPMAQAVLPPQFTGEVPGAARFTGAVMTPRKNWLTTYMLCLLFGWFGAHRFYTGHILAGVVQLATVGGMLIWWLFDLFSIALGFFEDSGGSRLTGPRSPVEKFAALGVSGAAVLVLAVAFLLR